MTGTVEAPLWLLVITGLLAAWVILERLLLPSVRWFFRRRANELIERLNRRLHLKLPTFSLTKRQVLVDRLTYDPAILDAVREHCDETGKPWAVALREVHGYAREIVPGFNPYVYFSWIISLCRWIVHRLYRVRLVHGKARGLDGVDRNASIVFVMNHRSNMDYMFVAYLAETHVALSFAVGEWARVWPLRPLVRSLGGYFVRRGSQSRLYRRVLERYVQMAVDAGVVQAVFPEGGLTRDGHFREAKIGLMDYMLRAFDPSGGRDIVFVPVALNYDRVVEDRNLLAEAGRRRNRKAAFKAVRSTIVSLGRSLRRRWRGYRFRKGYAAAGFGEPVSARQWCNERDLDFRSLPDRERFEQTRQFTDNLMECIKQAIPVLPVSLTATVFLTDPEAAWTRQALQDGYRDLVRKLDARPDGEKTYVVRRNPVYGVEMALRMLRVRQLIEPDGNGFRLVPGETPVLAFYANAIDHLFQPGA